MELFDIVDEAGCPTGRTVERSEAHSLGIRHRTAHVWVVRSRAGETEVLLQKRSDNKDSFPGRYDTSSAGHIRAGDEPLPSALRELEEELGIAAEPDELESAGRFRICYAMEFHGKLFRDNEVSFVYVLRRPVDETALRLQREEVASVAWFPLSAVEQAVREHDRKFCVPPDGLRTLRTYLNTHPL